MDIINKDTRVKEVKGILEAHGISTKVHGWEIIICMMLHDCDYIEVHEFGSNAYFLKMKEDDNG